MLPALVSSAFALGVNCDVEGTKGIDVVIVLDGQEVDNEFETAQGEVLAGIEIVIAKGAIDICTGKGNDAVVLALQGSEENELTEEANEAREDNQQLVI
jgi:hypothetical protein